MIKLIITDMDGTLLNDNHEIDGEFWELFNQMKKQDILFSVASGRQYYNLVEKFQDIQDEMIFIAENGTFVMHQGKELFSNCLLPQDVKYILKKLEGIENIGVVLCGKESAYITDTSPRFVEQVEKYYHRCKIVESFHDINEGILKVAVYDFLGSEENTYPHFIQDRERFQVVVSGKHWLDIMHTDSNKGEAIKKVLETLNITREETAAFGDYLNDLEMLKAVGHSYAMENAHDEIKKIARYITLSNNNSGVIHSIKEILRKQM
ncbi:MAG: HAD family hydrolase [Fusobacteriaceae bacterium]